MSMYFFTGTIVGSLAIIIASVAVIAGLNLKSHINRILFGIFIVLALLTPTIVIYIRGMHLPQADTALQYMLGFTAPGSIVITRIIFCGHHLNH